MIKKILNSKLWYWGFVIIAILYSFLLIRFVESRSDPIKNQPLDYQRAMVDCDYFLQKAYENRDSDKLKKFSSLAQGCYLRKLSNKLVGLPTCKKIRETKTGNIICAK